MCDSFNCFHMGWAFNTTICPITMSKVSRYDNERALFGISNTEGCSTHVRDLGAGGFGAERFLQGQLTKRELRRDHHPRCFTSLHALRRNQRDKRFTGNGQFRCTNFVSNPVHVNDLRTPDFARLGMESRRLTDPVFQSRSELSGRGGEKTR